MTIPVDILEAEVLSLSAPLRSRLLDKLIASLDAEPEWEEAWSREADRRESDIASGKAAWVPAEQVLARTRSKLA